MKKLSVIAVLSAIITACGGVDEPNNDELAVSGGPNLITEIKIENSSNPTCDSYFIEKITYKNPQFRKYLIIEKMNIPFGTSMFKNVKKIYPDTEYLVRGYFIKDEKKIPFDFDWFADEKVEIIRNEACQHLPE